MKALYSKLYQEFVTEDLSKLVHFVSMKGKHYDESDKKLMIIGRAVNDWGLLDVTDADSFGEAADKTFWSEGFTWIDDSGNSLCNYPKEGEKTYYLSKSAFWRTLNIIWRGLTGRNDKNWLKFVAWSNIYKIAPHTGNPDNKVCKAQIQVCREILKREIEVYRPTHIVVITGFEWWFYDKNDAYGISNIFDEVESFGKNTKENNQFVEGSASYKLASGRKIPVLITCRPETRPEDKFAQQVLEHFKLM